MILTVNNVDTGRKERVDLRKEGAHYYVRFLDSNNTKEFEINFERCGSFYSAIVEGKPYMVKFNTDGALTTVSVNSEYARMQVEQEGTASRRSIRESFSNRVSEISSKIPGKVVKVYVKDGQSVKEGDLILILEAMKMENRILAPKDGVIDTVLVKEGTNIPAHTVLAKYRD